jgi:hypothetical protein
MGRRFALDVWEAHENKLPNSVRKSGVDDVPHVNGIGPVKKGFRSGPKENSCQMDNAVDIFGGG